MNDHVVEGEVLKKFMQNEYDFRIGIYNIMDVKNADEMRQETKDYFIKISEQFKVVIDLHD